MYTQYTFNIKRYKRALRILTNILDVEQPLSQKTSKMYYDGLPTINRLVNYEMNETDHQTQTLMFLIDCIKMYENNRFSVKDTSLVLIYATYMLYSYIQYITERSSLNVCNDAGHINSFSKMLILKANTFIPIIDRNYEYKYRHTPYVNLAHMITKNTVNLMSSVKDSVRVKYDMDEFSREMIFLNLLKLRQQLIEKTWHPSRVRDWCLDCEDRAEIFGG